LRFDVHYPHYKGEFASVITAKTERVEALLGDFGQKDEMPHLAISVDMLDTGIDVPEVVNLVFFKTVRSPTKFWQMIGRGTRLCPDLYAPGEHKTFFYVFDFCQNLEFFKENPATVEGSIGKSTRHRSFTRRLALIGELDQRQRVEPDAAREEVDPYGDPRTDSQLRRSLSEGLRQEVARWARRTSWCAPIAGWSRSTRAPRPGSSCRSRPTRSSRRRSRVSQAPPRASPRRRGASTCSSMDYSSRCCARVPNLSGFATR
jgi:type I site-specific restriction endonuclease